MYFNVLLFVIFALSACGKEIPNLKNPRSSLENAPEGVDLPQVGGIESPGENIGPGEGFDNDPELDDPPTTSSSTPSSSSSSSSVTSSSSSSSTPSSSSSSSSVTSSSSSSTSSSSSSSITSSSSSSSPPSSSSSSSSVTSSSSITFVSISSCSQLQAIPQGSTQAYKLANDIDCTESKNWNNGQGFIPIQSFKGKLNGNRKVILNVVIKPSTELTAIGLIGSSDNAEIYDVGVVNANVVGAARITGILLGHGKGTKVVRSFSTGSVQNNYFRANEPWTWSATGGLVGYMNPSSPNDSIIMDSYSHATVKGASDYTGGLLGVMEAGNYTLIKRSFATGNVTANNGRIAALTTYSWGRVGDSFATGTALYNLCASVFGSITNTHYSGPTNCGTPQANADYFKGFVFNENKAPFTSWDFSLIWEAVDGDYPRLRGFNSFSTTTSTTSPTVDEADTVTVHSSGTNFSGYWKLMGQCSSEGDLIKIEGTSSNGPATMVTYVPCVDGKWTYNEMYGTSIDIIRISHADATTETRLNQLTPWDEDEIDCDSPYIWAHEMTDAFGELECHAIGYCSNGRPYVYAPSVSTQCTY